MNVQREIIYKQRREVLDGENMKDNILKMMEYAVESVVSTYSVENELVVEEPFMLELSNVLGITTEAGLKENDKVNAQDLKIGRASCRERV